MLMLKIAFAGVLLLCLYLAWRDISQALKGG